jgi:hypothetical protein
VNQDATKFGARNVELSGSGPCFPGWNTRAKGRRELLPVHLASLPPIMCNIGHSRDIGAPTMRQTVVCAPRHAAAACAEPLCAPDEFRVPIYGSAQNRGYQMMEQIREVSPSPRARMTGALYLLYFLTAILGLLLVSRGFAVSSNVTNVMSTVCYFVVTLLFYGLFKPVSGRLSLLAALFSLGGCIVMSLGLFHFDSPVSPLLFFGPFCLLIGYLIFRSSFLPRILGVAMAFAGLGWLAFLLPAVPNYLSTAIKVIGFLAELSLCLWLLVMGVNVQRWKQQASPAKTSIPTGEPLSATKG